MFAPRYAPKLNREVRHSLTWHSSESESALERFEPVAMDKLLLNGRGTLFALVAARRQGEIYKRGELTHTRSVCVGVAETGGKALLYDFWYTPSRRRRSEVASPP